MLASKPLIFLALVLGSIFLLWKLDPEESASSMDELGMPKRRFLELVRSPRYRGRVIKLGRLRLVRRTELLAHLEELSSGSSGEESSDLVHRSTVPSLLKELGLEEVPVARNRRD